MSTKWFRVVTLAVLVAVLVPGVAFGGRVVYATVDQVNLLIGEAEARVNASIAVLDTRLTGAVNALTGRTGALESSDTTQNARVDGLEARLNAMTGGGALSPMQSVNLSTPTLTISGMGPDYQCTVQSSVTYTWIGGTAPVAAFGDVPLAVLYYVIRIPGVGDIFTSSGSFTLNQSQLVAMTALPTVEVWAYRFGATGYTRADNVAFTWL